MTRWSRLPVTSERDSSVGRVTQKEIKLSKLKRIKTIKYHFHIPLSHTTAEINQKVVYTTFFREMVNSVAVPRGQTRGFAALSGLSTPSRLSGASRQARRSTLRRASAGGESESRMQDASARALVRPPPERKVASQL
jgi:hypothetical protein